MASGVPEGERDRCRGQDLAGAGWGPDGVARPASVKSSESHKFPDSCPQALGVEARPAARGRHSSSPHAKGHVLPRTHNGAASAVCHILFVPPLCPVYLLRGVPSRGPGPWRPPCPAGCCGEWWRATTLALLSSLDALQVCVCTCGRTQAWPCFLAGKHVGPGVAGPLRCASGAGGDPSPPP